MPFLNARRRHTYPRILVALLVIWCLAVFAYWWGSAAIANEAEEAYGGDFVVFWDAANMLEAGDPGGVYAQAQINPDDRKVVHYPPPYLLMLRPLAELPYWAALVTWSAIGLGALAFVIHRSVGLTFGSFCLPAIAVLANLGSGQNGFFTATLLGGGLWLLGKSAFAGGAVIGLLIYKPHFAPIAVLSLLLTRNWKALAGVVTSAGLFSLASLAAFGPGTWRAFVEDSAISAEIIYVPGVWEKMPSAIAALLLLDIPKPLAQIGQAIWSVTVIAAVVWLARAPIEPRLRNAGIIVATLAASPYVFFYDLTVLAFPMAWLLLPVRGVSPSPKERIVLGASAVLPIASWGIADMTNVQLGPLVILSLFIVVLSRARAEVRSLAREDPAQQIEPLMPASGAFPAGAGQS